MDEGTLLVLFLFGILAFIAFLVAYNHHRKIAERRLRLEQQSQLLDRIGSSGALSEFLQTDQGKVLLESLNEPEKRKEDQPNPRAAVMAFAMFGVILIPVGIGFMYAAPVEAELIIPAFMFIGAGIGCLIAAVVYYLLARRWGMFREQEPEEPRLTGD